MPKRIPFTLQAIGVLAVSAGMLLAIQIPSIAGAQAATGAVTGRVVWNPCVRIPLPMAPSAPGPDTGVAPDQTSPANPQVAPFRGLPAGAVLVAVQNTSLSTRTDENGKFTVSNVPAGQYLTLAAGPVANSMDAIAVRPNVFVSGGETLDVGVLMLGGGSPLAIPCVRSLPPADAVPGSEAPQPPNGPEPNP